MRGRLENVLAGGLDELLHFQDQIEGVFDATSAEDHSKHWDALSTHQKWVVDLTPSDVGKPMVPILADQNPSFHVDSSSMSSNYSMVTCGGQSSAPMLHAITKNAIGIQRVEISSSIASESAGPATRRNVDHYIQSTEGLASLISGTDHVKAILVLNPAQPPVMMRTTVTVEAEWIDQEQAQIDCESIAARLRESVPGYTIAVAPHSPSQGRMDVTAKVVGAGHFLPPFAGNLDIINAAAVETARVLSRARRGG
jgi:acetaldehyde dehydrogenase (acetylating)